MKKKNKEIIGVHNVHNLSTYGLSRMSKLELEAYPIRQVPYIRRYKSTLSSVQLEMTVNNLVSYLPLVAIVSTMLVTSNKMALEGNMGIEEDAILDEKSNIDSPYIEAHLECAKEPYEPINCFANDEKLSSPNRSIRRWVNLRSQKLLNKLSHFYSVGFKMWLQCEKSLESNSLFKKLHISGRAGMLIFLALLTGMLYTSASAFILKKGVNYASKSIISEIANNDVVIKAKNEIFQWSKARPYVFSILIGGTILCAVFHLKGAIKIKAKVPYPGPRVPFASEIDPCLAQQIEYVLNKIEEIRAVLLKKLEEENEVLPYNWPSRQDLIDLKIIDENGKVLGFFCICELGTICNLTVWKP